MSISAWRGLSAVWLARALLLGWAVTGPGWAEGLIETPMLAPAVAAGSLPPVSARVPDVPMIETGPPGEPGGDLRILFGSARDTRTVAVMGYARLVSYMPDYQLRPDLLQAYEVEAGRIFTFHLRPGLRWSDGAPVTTEDFRYWWEDVARNDQLSPTGPPSWMLRDGEAPVLEILDPLTLRYSWSKPMPTFLPMLAGAATGMIFRPSHYLKPFHERYADPATLAALTAAAHQRNWAALHNRMDNPTRNDNPDLPSLDPWILKTAPPAERFVFERNPYYYRIDTTGHQLPYIDRILATVADAKIIPAKAGAGETDLQSRYLRFDHYTFLKANEASGGYHVRLWPTGYGSQWALYPNLTARDPVWRALNRDPRWRQALSMAVDRHEINNVIYYGLGVEGQNTLQAGSPLSDPAWRTAFAAYDPAAARRLLDEMGFDHRGPGGVRHRADGTRLSLVVEYPGQSSEAGDVLELIEDNWREVGIQLLAKPLQIEILHNRLYAGDTVMTIDRGLENGLATAEMDPAPLAPLLQEDWAWPRWGQYLESHGMSGEAPDLTAARTLLGDWRQWLDATAIDAKAAAWRAMLQIQADNVFTIGLVAQVPQPVLVSDRLRNVPESAIYNFEPGAHLGMYKPDRFWLSPATPTN